MESSIYAPELRNDLHLKDPEAHPAPTLEEQKYIDEFTIRNKYALQMEAIVKPYSSTERETWFTQLKESEEWLADNNAVVPLITALASNRGISLALLVEKIMGNNALYRTAVGTLLGMQQAELDALE
jgi:hypothetical protein